MTRGWWDLSDLAACRDRFVDRIRIERSGCWKWLGPIQGGHGYGKLSVTTGPRQTTQRPAHRFAYEIFNGVSVLKGYDIDHLCRNRRCVCPAHLEPVTRSENVRRSPISQAGINAAKTHCPHGHEYTPENTYRTGAGRACAACKRAKSRARYGGRAA